MTEKDFLIKRSSIDMTKTQIEELREYAKKRLEQKRLEQKRKRASFESTGDKTLGSADSELGKN